MAALAEVIKGLTILAALFGSTRGRRSRGTLQGFTGVKDPYDRPEGPKPLITIPPFLQGVMELHHIHHQ